MSGSCAAFNYAAFSRAAFSRAAFARGPLAGAQVLAGLDFDEEALLGVVGVVEDALLGGELQLEADREFYVLHIDGEDGLVSGKSEVDLSAAVYAVDCVGSEN